MRGKERERDGGEKRQRGTMRWFTFDLSKGHSLPCGARARVRPLWAEQGVLIVLLVRVVGVVLRHGNWDGGGEELAPLPRILEAAERPRLLLVPYIYKQDRHKEKNCREIWRHELKERKKWRRQKKRYDGKRRNNVQLESQIGTDGKRSVLVWLPLLFSIIY